MSTSIIAGATAASKVVTMGMGANLARQCPVAKSWIRIDPGYKD